MCGAAGSIAMHMIRPSACCAHRISSRSPLRTHRGLVPLALACVGGIVTRSPFVSVTANHTPPRESFHATIATPSQLA